MSTLLSDLIKQMNTDQVGGRPFYADAPTDAALSFAIVTGEARSNRYVQGGISSDKYAEVEILCLGATRASADALANAVEAYLDNFVGHLNGTSTSTLVTKVRKTEDYDGIEIEIGAKYRSLNFSIAYRLTT